MKKFAWFKHYNDLLCDKRLTDLIDREGAKGYGTYIYIIERLNTQPDRKLSFRLLYAMAQKGFGKIYMEKIIRNYQLFNINGEYFESAIHYHSPAPKSTENVGNPSENRRETIGEPTEKEETPDQNASSQNEPKTLNDCKEERKPESPYARERRKSKENKKKETSSEEEKEEDDDDGKTLCRDGEKTCTGKETGPKHGSPTGPHEHGRCEPYRTWRELVDLLNRESEWKERVCMTSGFSALLAGHFGEALEIFKEHILLNGREKSIETQEDARRYFNNYTKEPRTSKALRQALLALDTQQQDAAPPDPYRYEQRTGGRRSYLGCLIPDDAPPRPNETAFWNEATHTWC